MWAPNLNTNSGNIFTMVMSWQNIIRLLGTSQDWLAVSGWGRQNPRAD
jgi:hypothetical protein